MDGGTGLSGQEVTTDALLKNEANTQEIERVKIGSNKICIREDLAKDKMTFSEESSRAIFEMGNVELIDLKKTSIQCPSRLHDGFYGTTTCICEPDKKSIRSLEGTLSSHVTHYDERK